MVPSLPDKIDVILFVDGREATPSSVNARIAERASAIRSSVLLLRI